MAKSSQLLHDFFIKIWYQNSRLNYILRPFSWFYCIVITLRKIFYQLNFFRSSALEVPVVVVGNITVGGTGKTPLVIWLANYLKQSGYHPGIISRGYMGKARSWPQQVRPDSDPVMVGDEAIVIARRTKCPMAVGPDRVASSEALIKYHDCDIIISDDGLQHYKLARDIEILVIDGVRRFGNGQCLPSGPLREPVQRTEKVDFLVTNGIALNNEYAMRYTGKLLYNLVKPEIRLELSEFRKKNVHAIAGIGNPERFFNYLNRQGLTITTHTFPDHYVYNMHDLEYETDSIVIMTEKDAVKCQRIMTSNMWVLPVEVNMKRDFGLRFLELLGQFERH